MTGGICSGSPATDRTAVVVRTLLIRGMLVGFVAGLLVFGFGRLVGESQVERAQMFESALDDASTKGGMAKGMPMPVAEPELVSREVQAGLGLFTGVVVYSTAYGGLFALVFAFVYGRVGRLSPRALSALLAVAGLVALCVVPGLKYPASPPAVGQPGTIGVRTALYGVMMFGSVAAMALAIAAGTRLAPRHGAWAASLWAAAGYVAVVAAGGLVLPAVDEVPDMFPAALLWQFRVASLGMQAILWTTIGLLFGWLTERAMAGVRLAPHRRLRWS